MARKGKRSNNNAVAQDVSPPSTPENLDPQRMRRMLLLSLAVTPANSNLLFNRAGFLFSEQLLLTRKGQFVVVVVGPLFCRGCTVLQIFIHFALLVCLAQSSSYPVRALQQDAGFLCQGQL